MVVETKNVLVLSVETQRRIHNYKVDDETFLK